jgi:SAM-dependent methyltransferase
MSRVLEGDSSPKQGLLSALQGYYATVILLQLRRLGLLSKLVQPNTPEILARELAVDPVMTRQLLDFLVLTTSVVRQTGRGTYQLNEPRYAELSFQLEKFVGAYGPATEAISNTLQHPDACADHVDRRALATAFTEAKAFGGSLVADLIAASGVSCLLDLGCGPASLLVDLARRDPSFQGVGIDASGMMCVQARRAVRAADVSRRIDIRHADASKLSQWLSPSLRKRVDSLHENSFLNEFFGQGERGVVKRLRALSRSFPGRRAWFVDYYSSIGQAKGNREAADFPLALLQDLAQVVSGQGVPPRNAKCWRRLYREVGCRLVRTHEFESPNIRWFIHEVML